MKRILLTTITLFALMLTTGCSPVVPKYQVTIDSITAPNIVVKPSIYEIKALKSTQENGLRFQQYAASLTKALNEQGYRNINAGEVAQETIYFDYGLEKVKEEIETYSQPDVSFHVGWGFPYGGFYGRHYHPFFYDNFYGGGYTTYRKRHLYYNRYITLLAKDASSKELWRVDVSSIGESKNLRAIIPLLIDAAKPYIGTTTAEPIQLVVKNKPKKKK